MDDPEMSESCSEPGNPQAPIYEGDYSFNTGTVKTLGGQDYGMLVAVLSIPVLVGIYKAWGNRKAETMEQFLLEYRSMPAFVMGVSAFASVASAVTIMGSAAENYDNSMNYVWVFGGLVVVVVVAAHLYHPLVYKLGVTTVYQYLGLRFNRKVRVSAACVFIVQTLAYNSIVFYEPSLAFREASDSLLLACIFAIGAVSVILVATGGMQGVVWMDLMHSAIMFASLIVVMVQAVRVVGDPQSVGLAVIRTNHFLNDESRTNFQRRQTIPGMLIGGFFTFGSFLLMNQLIVQKTVSCNTLREATIAIYIAFLTYSVLLCVSFFLGFYMGAFYDNCDPTEIGLAETSEQVLPLFVLDILANTNGMAGLFMAGLFSGALSTLSTSISAVTTIVLEDVIESCDRFSLTQRQAKKMSLPIALVYGFIALLGAYGVSLIGKGVEAILVVIAVTASPLFGIFSMGMFLPWVNSTGAISGLFGSILLTSVLCWTSVPPNRKLESIRCISNCNPVLMDLITAQHKRVNATLNSEPLLERITDADSLHVSYIWITTYGWLFCVIIGLVTSFASGIQKPADLDPDLVISLVDEVFPFFLLPERCRQYFRPVPLKPRSRAVSISQGVRPGILLGTFQSNTEVEPPLTSPISEVQKLANPVMSLIERSYEPSRSTIATEISEA